MILGWENLTLCRNALRLVATDQDASISSMDIAIDGKTDVKPANAMLSTQALDTVGTITNTMSGKPTISTSMSLEVNIA